MFTVGEVLNGAWEKFKANAGPFVLGALIVVFVPLVVQILMMIVMAVVAGQANSMVVSLLMNLVVYAVILVLQALLFSGYIKMSSKALRGETPVVGDMFSQSDKLIQATITMVITYLLTFIGSILLIIPGILVFMLLSMSLWYVVDKELDAITAIKASIEATKGALLPIFLYGLVLFLLSIPATCTIIGFVILYPVAFLSWGLIYMALDKGAEQAAI